MPDRLLPDRPEIDRAARHPSSGRPLREPSTVNCGPAAAPTGPPGNESRFFGTNEGSQVHHQDSQWTEGATGDPLILVRPSILPFESLASGRDEARYARGLAMPNLLRSGRPNGISLGFPGRKPGRKRRLRCPRRWPPAVIDCKRCNLEDNGSVQLSTSFAAQPPAPGKRGPGP